MKYPYLRDLIVNHPLDKIGVLCVEKSENFPYLNVSYTREPKRSLKISISVYLLVTLTDFCLLFTGKWKRKFKNQLWYSCGRVVCAFHKKLRITFKIKLLLSVCEKGLDYLKLSCILEIKRSNTC